MKYMNRNQKYGLNPMFRMNLQFFAEDGGSGDGGDGGSEQPTYEELKAQLEEARNARDKNKAQLDKALSEQKETKAKLKEKMTAEEQEAEARKADNEAKDARIQELELKFKLMDYTKRYMGIGMDEKTAESMASITGNMEDTDKFFTDLGTYIQSVVKKAGEDAVQNILNGRSDIKSGSGDNKTSLAVEKAKELAGLRNKAIDSKNLERFM